MIAVDDNNLDDRIRHQAYLLWLQDGRPEGFADEHWRLASEIVAAGAAASPGDRPDPPATDLGNTP